jgi:hypothetical protein
MPVSGCLLMMVRPARTEAPLRTHRYYHRLLNPKKLIEIKFTRLQARMTLKTTIRLYKLPDGPATGAQPLASHVLFP